MTPSIFKRAIAFAIDLTLISVFAFAMEDSGVMDSTVFSKIFAFYLYYFSLECIFDRTLGKFFVGTMVINEEKEYDEPRMIKRIAIRTLLRMIPFEQLSYLTSSRPMGLHDIYSKTMTVNSSAVNKKEYFGLAH